MAKNIVMGQNEITAKNVIMAENVVMAEHEGSKKKNPLTEHPFVCIVLPILLALIALGGTLFAVFYEKPKTFLPNPLLDQAEVLLVEEKYDEAIPMFDEAAATEPDNPRIWLGKYAALELSDRHEDAVQALREGTTQIKKRATGGKEIRAALEAAETSPEEGLAVVVESYQSFGAKEPSLKKFALRLLQVLVRVFDGAERFVRMLAEMTTEAATARTTAKAMTTFRHIFLPDLNINILMNESLAQYNVLELRYGRCLVTYGEERLYLGEIIQRSFYEPIDDFFGNEILFYTNADAGINYIFVTPQDDYYVDEYGSFAGNADMSGYNQRELANKFIAACQIRPAS